MLQAQQAYRANLDNHERPLRVALVLNGNAKAVSDRIIRDLHQLVQNETLFVSRSLDQSKFIARHIVNQDYDVVLCGGGDGTFTQCLTDVMELHPKRPPAFGVLRLGTGNAIANALGASAPSLRGFLGDLTRARQQRSQSDLPMLKVDGKLAPFAGVGLDSLILEDYNATKSALAKTPLAALGKGVPGYALAVATRSVWRYVLQPRPEVVIRNEGRTAWRMDLDGQPMGQPVPRGELLYKGEAGIAAASTIPFYGLGLRLFPQTSLRQDRFQLRVANVDALSVLSQLPALFRGEVSDPRIFDFFCTAISIHITGSTPLQIGGDNAGKKNLVHIGLTHIRAVLGEQSPEPTSSIGWQPESSPAQLAS